MYLLQMYFYNACCGMLSPSIPSQTLENFVIFEKQNLPILFPLTSALFIFQQRTHQTKILTLLSNLSTIVL